MFRIWKYAPDTERNQFNQDVVDQLNEFLTRWSVAPKITGPDDFYFRKQAPKNVDYDENDYIYYVYEQSLVDLDDETAQEWKELLKRPLFRGQYYELVIHSNYDTILSHNPKYITSYIDSTDHISRAYRFNDDRNMGVVLTQAAFLGFDGNMNVSEEAGSISRVEIDHDALFPTLKITFEYH